MTVQNSEKKINVLLGKIEAIRNRRLELISHPIMLEYSRLESEEDKLQKKVDEIKTDLVIDRINECGTHYLIGNPWGYATCLKCGLITKPPHGNNSTERAKFFAMSWYMIEHEKDLAYVENYKLDYSLAQKIYNKILEANPGIDSDTAIKYFEIALDNMIDFPRDESRAERLQTSSSQISYIERKRK